MSDDEMEKIEELEQIAKMEQIEQMEQIEKLQDVGVRTTYLEVKKKTMDALAEYGNKAIPAITKIADRTSYEDVKIHAMETVKKIKENE